MSINQRSLQAINSQRAELIVELFLQDLSPRDISKSVRSDAGEYDYLATFDRADQGMNLIAVEVKFWTSPVREHYPMTHAAFRRFALLNLPSMLAVVDAKTNDIYYAWLSALRISLEKTSRKLVPVEKITEATKKRLFKTVRRPDLLAELKAGSLQTH